MRCVQWPPPPLRIGTVRREVKCGGHPIHLTPSEYKILHVLALRPRRTFSKAVLMDRLYRRDSDATDNDIEVLVSNLRKKIRRPDEPPLIVTRRGYPSTLHPPSPSFAWRNYNRADCPNQTEESSSVINTISAAVPCR